MLDNLLTATTTTRTSLSNLKKKLSKMRIQVEELSADVEKIDTKFENVLSQAEIYKAKLEREMGRSLLDAEITGSLSLLSSENIQTRVSGEKK